MNGCIIPNTPIVVDLWKRGSNPSSKHHFLSHMHSDHTQGLSASWRWPIYCSPVSAKLLVDKFQIKAHLVRPLELGQSHVLRLDEVGEETMTVTLFDANHCPGSAMFLFEGYFGRILYTGDFRYNPSTFPESYLGPGRPVDKLYLDNTFNNPRCRFPCREDCKQEILEIVANHPDHEVVLGVYTLGKEDLLVDIALTLNTRVVVSPARMRTLQLLEEQDVFTTDKNEGRVQLVVRTAISKKNMAKWNAEAPTIAIIPTGLFSSLDGQPFINQENVFVVPYSDHSSYPELRQFVSRVCPRAIIPIVKDSCFMNSSRSVTDMHNFDDLLDKSPSDPFDIPPSVLRFLSSPDLRSACPGGSQRSFGMISMLRKRKNSFPRNSHAAKGVVYQDEEEQEQIQTVDVLEPFGCKVDSQQQYLAKAESESHRTSERQVSCSQSKPTGMNVPGESGSDSQITHTDMSKEGIKAVSSEFLKCDENALFRDRNASKVEADMESKILKLEPPSNLSSENWGNSLPQKSLVMKRGFLAKPLKRKSDKPKKAEISKSQGADSLLIESMSNKRSRVLPFPRVITPRLVENVQPDCVVNKSTRTVLSNKIEGYFQKMTAAAPTNEQLISVSVQCKLNLNDSKVSSLPAATSLDTNNESKVFSTNAAAQSLKKGTHSHKDHNVVAAHSQNESQKREISKNTQNSPTNETRTGETKQSIRTAVPVSVEIENSSTLDDNYLCDVPQERMEAGEPRPCPKQLSLKHVHVKPYSKQNSAGRGLRKAFRNFFSN